jgi:hypothetical protein
MARPFHEVISEVDAGRLMQLASEKLAEVVRGVGEVEKPGELTLKLSIKPNGEGKFFVDGKIVTKVPEQPVDTSMFFGDEYGNLSRNSPKQEELKTGLKAVG